MAVPLQHFVVGLGFLIAGAGVGVLDPLGILPGGSVLSHVHLLLIGWVCVTIMGAMTQFVPVWSGTTLHSRRLATAQLWLVVPGLVGFAGTLLLTAFAWLPLFGALVLGGIWLFVYNVWRTLWPVRPWDVTEWHFAMALGFFLLTTAIGLLLAVSYSGAIQVYGVVTHGGLRSAHATFAVFGAVLTTVFGALYQLGPMFTQSDPHGIDGALRRGETVGYPAGVLLLAVGRLIGNTTVARAGGLLVVAGVLAVGVVLARRLYEATVARTPMLTRYAVVAGAMGAWTAFALPSWLRNPTASGALFGSAATVHLLFVGVIGFVVVGTLYHVVPFIIWVHRYSDRLGLDDVPMIDDLYSDRLATVDFALLTVGGGALVAAEWGRLPVIVTVAGGALAVGGIGVFALNMVFVVREHSPHSIVSLVRPSTMGDSTGEDPR